MVQTVQTVQTGQTDKAELRRQMLAERRQMTAESAAELSYRLSGRLAELLLPRSERRIFSYLAYGREADIDALHRRLWQAGRQIAVPITTGLPSGVMQAAAYDPDVPLQKAALGVLEPSGAEIWQLQTVELVLAPGVAFDRRGNRLGHGKGYYDRYLPQLLPGVPVIGVCYDWQVVDGVPVDEYDRRMDVIVTDSRVIYPD